MTTALALDTRREDRLGFSEAVLCAWKSVPIIEEALAGFQADGKSALLTRLTKEQLSQIQKQYRVQLDYCEISQTAFFGEPETAVYDSVPCVISAGSSDFPVAVEAMRTLEFYGCRSEPFHDIGVAGIWRLEERLTEIRQHGIAIVVAGMDAALVSVIGGLFRGLVIALPTSVGYGVSDNGKTALNASLSSCAPGVVAVNINNGYGAAMAAIRALAIRNG
jgi:hypothetical protein